MNLARGCIGAGQLVAPGTVPRHGAPGSIRTCQGCLLDWWREQHKQGAYLHIPSNQWAISYYLVLARSGSIWHVSGTEGWSMAKGKRQIGNVRKLPSGRFQARYTAPD